MKNLKYFTVAILFTTILVINIDNGFCVDDKNITRLLNNQVIVSKQIMCVLEKSPCDQLGRQLKEPGTTSTAGVGTNFTFSIISWMLALTIFTLI